MFNEVFVSKVTEVSLQSACVTLPSVRTARLAVRRRFRPTGSAFPPAEPIAHTDKRQFPTRTSGKRAFRAGLMSVRPAAVGRGRLVGNIGWTWPVKKEIPLSYPVEVSAGLRRMDGKWNGGCRMVRTAPEMQWRPSAKKRPAESSQGA